MSSRSRVLRWVLSALMGTLIMAATFTATAGAKKPHKRPKPHKPAQKQTEPKPTKELVANCASIIAVTEVSSLTGLNLTAGQPAISVDSVGGLCSGNYVLDGTFSGGGQERDVTVSNLGVSIVGQTITGGPIDANAVAASLYQKNFKFAEAQDQACPGTAAYPTPITGLGTKAFTSAPCGAPAPEAIYALDGPITVTTSWENTTTAAGGTITGGVVTVGEVEPVVSHAFKAVGL